MILRSTLRLAAIFAVGGMFSLGLTASAGAQSYEPNDGFNQAYGPLVGGQNYDAALETSNDQDYYYFNTSGQRQLDITMTGLSSGCGGGAKLIDVDGEDITSWSASFSGQQTGHLTYTSPARRQYGIRVSVNVGCPYRLKVAPADALTTESPGLTARLGTPDSDAFQRIYLDGQLMGETRGSGAIDVALGHPGAASQIVFEAQNISGSWSWNSSITNIEGRGQTTIWTENQSSSCCGASRIGLVRRVVLTPSGGIISTCGEVIAPATCFPRDTDGDGVDDSADQCLDTDGVAPTGCPDADRDGVPDSSDKCTSVGGPGPSGCPVKQRVAASVTLKRRGSSYSGKVKSSQSGCAASRRVVLRRVGKGTRSFGSATTTSKGSFTIRRSRRLRGRVYVALAASNSTTLICERTASKRISG
jgi:hypothetical protein